MIKRWQRLVSLPVTLNAFPGSEAHIVQLFSGELDDQWHHTFQGCRASFATVVSGEVCFDCLDTLQSQQRSDIAPLPLDHAGDIVVERGDRGLDTRPSVRRHRAGETFLSADQEGADALPVLLRDAD